MLPDQKLVVSFLESCVDQVAARMQTWNVPFLSWRKQVRNALSRAVLKRCEMVLQASAATSKTSISEAEKWAAVQYSEQRRIDKETRGARWILFELQQKIERAENRLAQFTNAHVTNFGFPTVPKPSNETAPTAPGIYFVWEKGRVVYVGQTKNLFRRTTSRHHAIHLNDSISWVEVTFPRLNFAEAFYIGSLHPSRNFGLRAASAVPADKIGRSNSPVFSHL